MIADAGDRASRRFLDFFAASIGNDNTHMAYYRAVCSFFARLEQHGIGGLVDIEPFHVAAYIKALKVRPRQSGNETAWATAAEQRAMDVSVIGITRLIAAKESLPGQT
jgi:hypothetical protein